MHFEIIALYFNRVYSDQFFITRLLCLAYGQKPTAKAVNGSNKLNDYNICLIIKPVLYMINTIVVIKLDESKYNYFDVEIKY